MVERENTIVFIQPKRVYALTEKRGRIGKLEKNGGSMEKSYHDMEKSGELLERKN